MFRFPKSKLPDMSNDELEKLMKTIDSLPENQATDGGIYLYTAKARKQTQMIAEQITHNIIETKRKNGTLSDKHGEGYSGRKCNRR